MVSREYSSEARFRIVWRRRRLMKGKFMSTGKPERYMPLCIMEKFMGGTKTVNGIWTGADMHAMNDNHSFINNCATDVTNYLLSGNHIPSDFHPTKRSQPPSSTIPLASFTPQLAIKKEHEAVRSHLHSSSHLPICIKTRIFHFFEAT